MMSAVERLAGSITEGAIFKKRGVDLFLKHGSHNQKTHGGKGGGGESSLSQGATIDTMNQQRTPEFLGKISPDEMKAIEDYTSGTGAYGAVNLALREGEVGLLPSEKATADRIIPNLDSVIADAHH